MEKVQKDTSTIPSFHCTKCGEWSYGILIEKETKSLRTQSRYLNKAEIKNTVICPICGHVDVFYNYSCEEINPHMKRVVGNFQCHEADCNQYHYDIVKYRYRDIDDSGTLRDWYEVICPNCGHMKRYWSSEKTRWYTKYLRRFFR